MNLVKICQERLAKAQKKIEIIARNSAGKTTVKDFEPTPEAAAPRSVVDEPQNTNEEIKLFEIPPSFRRDSQDRAIARWDPFACGYQGAERTGLAPARTGS